MASAPNAGQAFFPLDDELGLLPGTLTPSLQEDLVRLGTWMPFARASQELQHFRRVAVSRPVVERTTEAAGAACVAVQTAEAGRIERELPPPPSGPAKQFLSVDGAMVPLVGGVWAEAKTLVIGEVQPPAVVRGEEVVRTTRLSYFSRLAEAETFQRLALVETQRRGLETAGLVAAVTDGSEWCQKFVDHHRSDAVRILDFPHAGEHLNGVGQAAFGEASPAAQQWLEQQLHALKHAGPQGVLTEVRRLLADCPEPAAIAGELAYLEKRQEHMDYPAYRSLGLPLGDGATESGNKLVVEARLKGSGMHWARPHVDPMLALRNAVCSDRWDEAWPQISQQLRQQARQHQLARHHQVVTSASAGADASSQPPKTVPAPSATLRAEAPQAMPRPGMPPSTVESGPRRPAANHPWRRMPIGRARFKSPAPEGAAKT
jgi:hypothetical protein